MANHEVFDSRPWLRHYEPGVPHTIAYPAHPVQRLLDDAAGRFPNRPALTFFGRDLSYLALRGLTDRFASGLRSLGLQPGDRHVSLTSPTAPSS